MEVRTKAIVTVVMLGLVIGAFSLNTSETQLYKGQIFDQQATKETLLKPDLIPAMEVIMPDTNDGDIKVSATVKNIGEGEITAGNPFSYTLYINGQEVFSNTDSYTSMLSGDEFNFVYPIPRAIYQYTNTGTIKFVVDTQNTIEESNEDNNQKEVKY